MQIGENLISMARLAGYYTTTRKTVADPTSPRVLVDFAGMNNIEYIDIEPPTVYLKSSRFSPREKRTVRLAALGFSLSTFSIRGRQYAI